MSKKTILAAIFSMILSAAALIPIYGAEKDITSINLSFSWDKEPKGGDLIGHVSASSSSNQFTVEGAEYLEDDDTWIFGTRPEAEVELSANEDFQFSSSNRRIFTLSGCNVVFKEASIDSDGSTLILRVYFPTIDDVLPGTTAVSWNGKAAVWDEVGGAAGYEVKLYKDGSLSDTVTTPEASYDFSTYVNNEGAYTFTVRALGKYSTQSSEWSNASDPFTVSKSDAWYHNDGKWKRVPGGWRFVYENDDYPINAWRMIEDKWYFFNQKGYMAADCYVKADEGDVYHWVGSDGAWVKEKDTNVVDEGLYRILK